MLKKLEFTLKLSEFISGKAEIMCHPPVFWEGVELVWKRSIPQHAHAEQ